MNKFTATHRTAYWDQTLRKNKQYSKIVLHVRVHVIPLCCAHTFCIRLGCLSAWLASSLFPDKADDQQHDRDDPEQKDRYIPQ